MKDISRVVIRTFLGVQRFVLGIGGTFLINNTHFFHKVLVGRWMWPRLFGYSFYVFYSFGQCI